MARGLSKEEAEKIEKAKVVREYSVFGVKLTVKLKLDREELFELPRKGPYYRYVKLPYKVDIATDFLAAGSSTDKEVKS